MGVWIVMGQRARKLSAARENPKWDRPDPTNQPTKRGTALPRGNQSIDPGLPGQDPDPEIVDWKRRTDMREDIPSRERVAGTGERDMPKS